MNPTAATSTQGVRILEEVRSRAAEWVRYVETLASLESPTSSRASQRAIQSVLAGSLEEVGYRVRRVAGSISGGLILGLPVQRVGPAFQLLVGHTDTVWPIGTLQRMPVRIDGGMLRGPGVFDMKAGLAQAIFALRALRALDLTPTVAPVVLFNSDEETGSRESTRHIRRLARGASRAFILEPALGLDGKLKTARKGVARFHVRIYGRGAHAGLDPARGASAVQELAHVVDALYQLADPARGIVVNVGEIQGGVSANMVAPEARAEVDVRVNSIEDGRWIEERIRGLEPTVPGCRLEIEGGLGRPPLERTERNRILWAAAKRAGAQLGLELDEGLAGGGSDGNTTSLSTPTLDGLGAVGDGAHADHEHVDIGRSLERCALLAALLLLPPRAQNPSAESTDNDAEEREARIEGSETV
jgi:glutamate carboxypeptidase